MFMEKSLFPSTTSMRSRHWLKNFRSFANFQVPLGLPCHVCDSTAFCKLCEEYFQASFKFFFHTYPKSVKRWGQFSGKVFSLASRVFSRKWPTFLKPVQNLRTKMLDRKLEWVFGCSPVFTGWDCLCHN